MPAVTVIVENPAPVEVQVDPRATGVPGPQGPAGAAGATGPQGPQGPAGAAGTVDNSAVNAAVAQNPSASRAAMGAERAYEIKTASFTAEIGGKYLISVLADIIITDPAGGVSNQDFYEVFSLVGGFQFNGTGPTYGSSTFLRRKKFLIGGWSNVSPTFADPIVVNGSQWTGAAFTGPQSFSGQVELTAQAATNPTSAMTRALGDARYLTQPFQLDNPGVGSVAGSNVSMGPFFAGRSENTWTQGFGNNNVPGACLPFFSNRQVTLTTVAINHTAGTNPTAFLEVAFYAANATTILPDAFLGKVSFPLSATGKKTQNFAAPITASGLFWAIVRPSVGDIAFKASGNGASLQLVGHNANGQNAFLSWMFGRDTQSNGVNLYCGTMTPVRSGDAFNLLPTSFVHSQITITQTANNGQGFPTVLIY